MARRCGQASEWIVLAMVCLSPWAFGAVTAWAELGLYAGAALVALLGAASGGRSVRPRPLTSGASLALGALVLFALAQTAVWPGWLAGRAAVGSSAPETAPVPNAPERVLGDAGPPVAPPGPSVSRDPERTADAATRLATAWVLFLAVSGAAWAPGSLRRLGLALAGNAALLSLFAVVQTLSWNGRMYWVLFEMGVTARGGPFVNKNHLAAYLNLGLGFALIALIAPGRRGAHRAGRGRRLWAAYAAGLIAVGVVASLSRGGFVAMLTATAALLLLGGARPVRAGAGLALSAGLAAALFLSVGELGPFQRLATLTGSGAYDDRLALWKVALRAWSARPLSGFGLGTFATSAARFFDRDDGFFGGSFAAHAENEYVEALVEGGVVGLGLALLLLASVAGLGLRALAASARDPDRRASVLGALFGLAALATQCLSDFPLHVPAVAVVAVILAAHLARAGRDGGDPPGTPPGTPSARAGGAVLSLTLVALSLFGLRHGLAAARADSALAAVGVPPAGFGMPTATLWDAPLPRLARARTGLEEALRRRPDWAEGHVRLGIVLLSQYRRAVADLAEGRAGDPGRVESLADPLWLHALVHGAGGGRPVSAGELLGYEPVRLYLAPAARAFLEARRCCPVWGLPHAELASLDYLLAGGEPTSAHAGRALRLAGPDGATIAMAARAAAQAGDLRLAALGWRKLLLLRGDDWEPVADQARAFLTPEQVLEWVSPDGRFAVRFADRFYAEPGHRPDRDRFLEWAVARLPGDAGTSPADRLGWEAQALARLGRSAPAAERMRAALALEPRRAGWRKDLVEWLIGWGKLDEAHDQALLGLHFAPDDPDARRAAELAADALARGSAAPPPR